MGLTETENVALSLHYRLWGILVQNGWAQTWTGVPLAAVTGVDEFTQDPIPANTYHYANYPKPLVFINAANEVTASGVTVYQDGHVMPASGYTVDYINHRITMAVTPTGALTADLNIFDVEVVEGYPAAHELQMYDVPIVAWDISQDDGRDGVLGTFIQFNARFCKVFVMAKDRRQRQALTHDIKRFIRFMPYVNYSTAAPLDENNALDPTFSYADQLDDRMAVPRGVRADYLEPRQGGSDKERYRSLIAFEVERLS